MKKVIGIFSVGLMVSGCAGTSMQVSEPYTYNNADTFSYNIVEQDNVTPQGMSIFKGRLDLKMKELGLLSEDNNKEVEVVFTNYYMRHGATRALLGIMAGSDNVTTKILIKDAETGSVDSEFEVVSKNPTAVGRSKRLLQRHAEKIANYIKNGKQ